MSLDLHDSEEQTEFSENVEDEEADSASLATETIVNDEKGNESRLLKSFPHRACTRYEHATMAQVHPVRGGMTSIICQSFLLICVSWSAEHHLRLRVGIHLEMNVNRLIQKQIIITACLTFALWHFSSLSSRVGGAGDILLALENSECEFDSVSVCGLVHVCTDTTLYLSVRCYLEGINSKNLIHMKWKNKILTVDLDFLFIHTSVQS